MTLWSMFPHTREGVISDVERTSEDRRGLRRHWGALERAVAVKRRSGWRMRRLFFVVMFIEEVIDEDDCVRGSNVPMTLMVSPEKVR